MQEDVCGEVQERERGEGIGRIKKRGQEEGMREEDKH